jgi:hypothetical protein
MELAAYCDPRLHQLNIGYWTRIRVTNEFAAAVISLYLEVDHPTHGFFDADLFLDDLVNQRHQFCSKFLVSSLLYYGCVSFLLAKSLSYH